MASAFTAAPTVPRRLPSPLPLHGPSSQPRRLRVSHSRRHLRTGLPPRARLSDSHSSYRRGSLLATASRLPLIAPPVPASLDLPVESPAVLPSPPTSPSAPLPDPPRYLVRPACASELYTVADIRCEAFYGSPTEQYFYPVRRREIYMAMRDRLASGNRCLVVLDVDPPEDWGPFTNEEGHLVVGSLDVSLHGEGSGKRVAFGASIKGEGFRIYVSSMAVRLEWQRRGLAQLLLNHVDELAQEFRVKDMFLHVEWDNVPAVRLYSKCGFVSTKNDDPLLIPKWLHFLAKREHTLMRKRGPK